MPGASSMRRPGRRELCSRREGAWEGEGSRIGTDYRPLTPTRSPDGGEGVVVKRCAVRAPESESPLS